MLFMAELIKNISSTVKFLREQKGLSQSKLAELSGVHEKTIISVDSGKHSVTIDVLEKICKILEIEPYELLLPPKSTIREDLRLDVNRELKNIKNTIDRILDFNDKSNLKSKLNKN